MHETHTHQTIPEGRDTDVAQPIDCALNYVERFLKVDHNLKVEFYI